MLDWLSDLAGPTYATAIMWTLGALLLLVLVLVAMRIFRSMTFGTYIAGGRHRRHRLAVSDAAAVDSHRRLVLVRRDDVEHLILIGGPTDVVVEQNIRGGGAESVAPSESRPAQPQPQPAPAAPAAAPKAPPPRPAPPPQPSQPPRPPIQVAAVAPQPVRPAPSPVQARPVEQPVPAPVRASPPTVPATADASMDDMLLDEINAALDRPAPATPRSPAPQAASLEDEMSRLLGDLSEPKR